MQLRSITSWPRVLSCVVLGAVVTALLLFQHLFRIGEAQAAAALYNLVTPTFAASRSPVVWFGTGSANSFGLVITPDCSSALLLVPLLALGMALALPLRLPLARVLSALAAAAALLVTGNLLRIGVIAAAVRIGGTGLGYEIGHLVIGSAMSVLSIGTSLILMTFIITSHRSTLTFPDAGNREVPAR